MLKNGQTYFKNLAVHEHHEIFKVCLAIFQHMCLQASLQASLRFELVLHSLAWKVKLY